MNVRPIYGKHYAPGYVMFTQYDGSFLSDGIEWFLSAFDEAEFNASHVLIVQDERWGIESAEKGVRWCRLRGYFDDPKYKVVIRKPYNWTESVGEEIVKRALNYYGRPYDYFSLVLGFPLQIVSKLASIIKPLRKLPVPLHIPSAYVCSAFVAQALKDTGLYDIPLFREWHVTRITPSMLYREFPWSPLKFESPFIDDGPQLSLFDERKGVIG